MYRNPTSRILCWLVCLFAGILPASAAYDALYAFGDSLTDTGREGPEPPLDALYYNGRYSNGPLWVEYLSSRLGLAYNASNNLARSGAQSDDTLGQVTNFVAAGAIDASLFVVWAGGNDFLQTYDQYWFNDAGWDAQTTSSAANISNAVVSLIGKGAKNILVPNTVDVTKIPSINPLPGLMLSYLRDKVELFNAKTFAALDKIAAAYPGIHIFKADIYNRVDTLLSTASNYGFTDTSNGAIDDPTLLDKSFDGPGANYIFWDPIHPTTKAHALVADYFLSFVAPLSPQLGLARSTNGFSFTASTLHLGKGYTLQKTTNFLSWTNVRVLVAYNSAPLRVTLTNDSANAFFRLK